MPGLVVWNIQYLIFNRVQGFILCKDTRQNPRHSSIAKMFSYVDIERNIF